jgi:hypothetical protein
MYQSIVTSEPELERLSAIDPKSNLPEILLRATEGFQL